MKNAFFALLAFVALTVTSCGKDDTPAPQKTKTELLTTGTWKFSSATANGADITNQNPPFEPCKKDNILSFTSTGSGNINEGATKCNPADATDTPFTWNWASNETILHISTPLFTGGSSDFTLESISATQLIVTQGYSPVAGPIILIRMVFIH